MARNVSITVRDGAISGEFERYHSLSLISNGEIGQVSLSPEEGAHNVLSAANIKQITSHDVSGVYNITSLGNINLQMKNFSGCFESTVVGLGKQSFDGPIVIDRAKVNGNRNTIWGHSGYGKSRLYLIGSSIYFNFELPLLPIPPTIPSSTIAPGMPTSTHSPHPTTFIPSSTIAPGIPTLTRSPDLPTAAPKPPPPQYQFNFKASNLLLKCTQCDIKISGYSGQTVKALINGYEPKISNATSSVGVWTKLDVSFASLVSLQLPETLLKRFSIDLVNSTVQHNASVSLQSLAYNATLSTLILERVIARSVSLDLVSSNSSGTYQSFDELKTKILFSTVNMTMFPAPGSVTTIQTTASKCTFANHAAINANMKIKSDFGNVSGTFRNYQGFITTKSDFGQTRVTGDKVVFDRRKDGIFEKMIEAHIGNRNAGVIELKAAFAEVELDFKDNKQ
jgi:hypothetical protein